MSSLPQHDHRQQHETSSTDSSVLIFLDIDGVLLPFGSHSFTTDSSIVSSSLFPNPTLLALQDILLAIPQSQIVLSSTWRMREVFVQQIRADFDRFTQEQGGTSPLRHIRWTEVTPLDLCWSTRQHEIYEYLKRRRLSTGGCSSHADEPAWVVLDDEELIQGKENTPYRQFFKGKVVKTDSHRGLTAEDAQVAIQILKQQIQNP